MVNFFSIGFHFLFTWIATTDPGTDFSVILYLLMALPCFTLAIFTFVREDYSRSRFEEDEEEEDDEEDEHSPLLT